MFCGVWSGSTLPMSHKKDAMLNGLNKTYAHDYLHIVRLKAYSFCMNVSTLCALAAKDLARLCVCSGSSEPWVLAYAQSTMISLTCSFISYMYWRIMRISIPFTLLYLKLDYIDLS